MRECLCQAPRRAKWSNRGALAALFHQFSAFESESARPVCVLVCVGVQKHRAPLYCVVVLAVS